jgi:hypothetical protein
LKDSLNSPIDLNKLEILPLLRAVFYLLKKNCFISFDIVK